MIIQLFTSFFALLSIILITEGANPVKQSILNMNNEPIIGILSQELIPGLYSNYSNEYDSYIAASYIKFVEGAGAQAVPIWIGKNASYYEDLISKLNGVLFPGGDVDFFASNGYADAGDIIYKIAKRYNDNGDYFPILGICLGFELLTYLSANRVEHRTNCTSVCQAIPLNFTSDYKQSKLFERTPEKIINILKTQNVTANYHNYCVTKSDLERVNLTDSLRVMSLNNDENGLEFISTIEDKKYPFYGLQFHPEKNDYEWVKGRNIPHSRNATIINQEFADFFVTEARKSFHKFDDDEERLKTLIYNYNPTYTGIRKSVMILSYFFKTRS